MDARSDLVRLLSDGINLHLPPQGPPGTRPTRRSAVLILFGALDQIYAEPASTQSIPVITTDNSQQTQSAEDRAVAHMQAPKVPADLDVLLLRRADGMRHHPGQIAFPGGGIDPEDESDIAAALREAEEETGLDPSGVEVLGTLPELPIVVSNNLVTPVIGWWSRPSEIAAVDHTEAIEVFRVPVAELLDPLARGTGVLTRAPHIYRSEAFQLSERLGKHVVWGFTGILLSKLFDQLGWSETWDPDQEFPITLV